MKIRAFLPILAFSVLLVPACSSEDVVNADEDDGGSSNEASMEVSGAVEAGYSGTATYHIVAGGLLHAITITFDNDEGRAELGIEEVTDEGTYLIGQTIDEPASLEITLDDVRDLEGAFSGFVLIESGSVTIRDLQDNRIDGRFSGSGETGATGNPVLTVEGEFSATCTDAPGVNC